MCLLACMYVYHGHAGANRRQKGVSDLKNQSYREMVVSCLTWALGPKYNHLEEKEVLSTKLR